MTTTRTGDSPASLDGQRILITGGVGVGVGVRLPAGVELRELVVAAPTESSWP